MMLIRQVSGDRIQLFFILLISIFCISISFSQQNKIDSILTLLKNDQADTNKLIHLYSLSDEFETNENYSDGLIYGKQALALADVILNKASEKPIQQAAKKYKAKTYNIIGIIYKNQGNYPEALKNHVASLKIKEELGDKKGMSSTYINCGNIYYYQGNYPEALKNYFIALKIKEELGDKKGISDAYINIGNIYYYQGNYSESLKNCFAALKIKEEIGDKKGIAFAYNNIGNVYEAQGNYHEALKCFFAALKIREAIDDKKGVSDCYNNIGNILTTQGNYSEALKNQYASLKIAEELGDTEGVAASCNNIGIAFTKQKKYKEAEEFLNKARIISKELGLKDLLKDTYSALTILDSSKGNYKGAYENHKLYIHYRDSLDNEETRKKTIQSQMTYDFEKKEAVATVEHKKELENQDALAEEKSRKQKLVIGLLIIGALLVIVFAGFIFRSLRITRKQKNIIEDQKELVEHQKLVVEEHQKEIVDSITYAKRIQYSLLANKQLLDANLPEHFVLFKPKDIVSGDFYWATKKTNSKSQIPVSNTQNLQSEICNRFYIAACDSTGHGVPGAFMSLLNISFLNEAVNEKNILEPHEILNHVRKRLIENMDGGQDGMDCILVCIESFTFEKESNSPFIKGARGIKITYSAANNAPCIIKNGELISLEADKMPVGKGERTVPFTLRSIDCEKGDSLYLYTDGYADQFGGPKGKKFKYKQLDELLISISNLKSFEQSEKLDQRFEDWKGNLEQVDDMLVIGIKI